MTEDLRPYHYVGPADVLASVQPGTEGREIGSPDHFTRWLTAQDKNELKEPFTFVIDVNGTLRLAPQRSEHVACAGGAPVLSAGEITFVHEHSQWAVGEISNQSTGYCPDLTSWSAVQAALDRAGLHHPGTFTHPIVFRRCPACHERNIVKDDHFVCAICEADLPEKWNFD